MRGKKNTHTKLATQDFTGKKDGFLNNLSSFNKLEIPETKTTLALILCHLDKITSHNL